MRTMGVNVIDKLTGYAESDSLDFMAQGLNSINRNG
jgi:hypothetical protein